MRDIPNDQAERDRIRTDLATCMLVEAGAGSGKTTSLVDRMLEHVRTGTRVERIAAVTFTRKSANELREKFQLRLEQRVREAAPESDEAARCERALREIDRAFLGTIHAFCARLLRERPLEAGLDPGFREVSEEPWAELKRRFWQRWVERARRDGDPDFVALDEVGVDARRLFESFELVMTYPDVEFPVGHSARPDTSSCRAQLETLLAAARRSMPVAEPAAGWDDLMRLVRRLELRRKLGKFDDLPSFCDSLEAISDAACKVTQNRWSSDRDGKRAAKELGERFVALLDGPIAELLRCWREHRYPIVMRVLQRAATEFARERHSSGQLGFEDLLLLTAKLLRENPAVRDELGARYASLLVDEFQDTDPIQAEVCFLLTSDASQGTDWRTVTPRPGSLFVVGDPKQSIFRFRRADIQIYELVKRRMEAVGSVLSLTANFRSVSSVEAVVNGHFANVFPAEATAEQAPYRAMETRSEPTGRDGVYRYRLRMDGRTNKQEVMSLDATMIAAWIARRIAEGKAAGDFMIIVPKKEPIAWHARALTEFNIPVITAGASLAQEQELRELLVVLRALADPENPVAVVAALEGLFFGLSPADLWTASRRGTHFVLTRAPSDEADGTTRALARMHEWWRCAQRHPADVLVERILDDSGLLLHAASQPLGDTRAGALLHMVESLRVPSTTGATGLPDAMERIGALLATESADAQLRPGRTDAVRVMNLHKAKGLEADVVILAAPIDRTDFEPVVHITRAASGRATGGLCLHRDDDKRCVIAHPPRWNEMKEAEAGFQDAELARLLYVAATRAKRELIVAQCEVAYAAGPKPDASIWRPLAPVLEEHAMDLVLAIESAPGRSTLPRTAASLADATAHARGRMLEAQRSSLRFATVTREIKGTDADRSLTPDREGTRGGGKAWGRAVHRSLEAMLRGRTGDSLRRFVHAVSLDEELDARSEADLLALLERTAATTAWLTLTADGSASAELTVMHHATEDGVETISEGVIDAAVQGPDGWRVTDWKTDVVDDAGWEERRKRYDAQVATYASMLAALTGRPATGTIHRVT